MLDLYRLAFSRAFTIALQEMGTDALKRTSLFGSNDKQVTIRNEEHVAKAA
ncbi:hypothetical protein J4P41_01735 [Gluconobacter sp. NFX36]|uniref:hypothetical protein n=1 Tax=Gluconobacter sp. NFX36 TaxID=2819535 RepID=UPI003CE82678